MRGAAPPKGRAPRSTRSKGPGKKQPPTLGLQDRRRPRIWNKLSARVSPREEDRPKGRGKAPMQKMADDGVNMDEVEAMETEMSPDRMFLTHIPQAREDTDLPCY